MISFLGIIERVGGQSGKRIYIRPVTRLELIGNPIMQFRFWTGNSNCLSCKDGKILEELLRISINKEHLSNYVSNTILSYNYNAEKYFILLEIEEGGICDFSYVSLFVMTDKELREELDKQLGGIIKR